MKKVLVGVIIIVLCMFEFNKTGIKAIDDYAYSDIELKQKIQAICYETDENLKLETREYQPRYINIDDWINDDGGIKNPVDEEMWLNTPIFKERCELCTIPKTVIDTVSTKQLFELVIDSKINYIINIYDDVDEGMKAFGNAFNGLGELLEREDCTDVVLEFYKNYNIPRNKKFDTSIINERSSSEDLTEVAYEILNNETYYNQLMEDMKTRTIIKICEWILYSKINSYRENSNETIKVSRVINEKNRQKEDSDFLNTTSYYFTDKIENYSSEAIALQSSNTTFTIFTPSGNKVVLEKIQDANIEVMSEEESIGCLGSYAKYINKCVYIMGPGTNRYNCHAYAWLTMVPGYSSYAKKYQLNSPRAFIDDRRVYSISKPRVGCVINYGVTTHSMYVEQLNYTCSDAKIYNDVLISEKMSSKGPLVKWPLKMQEDMAGAQGRTYTYYIFK